MLPAGRRHSSGLDGPTNTVINCECDPPPPACALATRGQPPPGALPTLFLLMALNASSQPGAETAIQTAWFLQYLKCDPCSATTLQATNRKQSYQESLIASVCPAFPCQQPRLPVGTSPPTAAPHRALRTPCPPQGPGLAVAAHLALTPRRCPIPLMTHTSVNRSSLKMFLINL